MWGWKGKSARLAQTASSVPPSLPAKLIQLAQGNVETVLEMRILTNGLKVYGFGEKKTPLPFVYACSTFLYLETIDQAVDPETSKVAASVKKTGKELKQDTKLMNLLRGAVSSTQDDDGWSSLAEVGAHIANQASFDPRNYGYAKLSGVFEAIDLFEIQRKNKVVYVRSKQKNTSTQRA